MISRRCSGFAHYSVNCLQFLISTVILTTIIQRSGISATLPVYSIETLNFGTGANKRLLSETAIQVNINIMLAFVAIRHAVSAWQDTNLKVEQLSHKVDSLNARVDEILHEQNENNMEMAVQIGALNDAFDQLREKSSTPRKRIGYKHKEK